jgi:hypothetical protein
MQDLSSDSDNIQTDKAWHDRRSGDGAVVHQAAISDAELCCYA